MVYMCVAPTWWKDSEGSLNSLVVTLGELAYIVIEYTPIILHAYYEYNLKDRY
jgi:hypothetical protein